MVEPILEEGVPPEEYKFCTDCKHLLGIRYQRDDTSNWRCIHPRNLKENRVELDLVSGIKKYHRVYHYENLYDLRKSDGITLHGEPVCGQSGLWYEEYEEPSYSAPVTPKPASKKSSIKNISADDL